MSDETSADELRRELERERLKVKWLAARLELIDLEEESAKADAEAARMAQLLKIARTGLDEKRLAMFNAGVKNI
jgi:hypothetical protein